MPDITPYRLTLHMLENMSKEHEREIDRLKANIRASYGAEGNPAESEGTEEKEAKGEAPEKSPFDKGAEWLEGVYEDTEDFFEKPFNKTKGVSSTVIAGLVLGGLALGFVLVNGRR